MIRTATRFTTQLVLIVAVLGTIGCDRMTKHLAADVFAGTPGRSYLGETVWLGYVENPGGFLSVGANLSPGVRTIVFTGGTGLMLLALTVVALRHQWRGWPAIGLALFLAGGVSNWIDRAVHGSVIDFMHIEVGPLRTGVFNVADMAIMLGAVLVVFAGLGQGLEERGSDQT